MDSPEFSMLSSLRGDFASEDYIQPHYKEAYRLAIDHLVKGGRDSYQEFLKGERLGSFLSEDELLFITTNTKRLPPQNHTEDVSGSPDTQSSSGTYWPVHSDVQAPDLDLGWPEVMHEKVHANIDLFFHPPRHNSPTIKEIIRKHIQDARQVIGVVMDIFTDVDIFKEIVDASIRGVPVYVLLDDFHLKSFLTMAENQDVKIQQLRNMRVRTVKGQDYLCRSGATFHGAMKQKFLLIDCHTAIYGSYSFAWSFEKINLSMVQVIKGHLVKSYDEEFRTLYARSTVSPQLCPPEGFFQRNRPHGQQNLLNSHSVQKIERRNHLRHSLDAVYRKTCERKFGTRDLEETLFEDEAVKLDPFIENGFGVQDKMPHIQSPEMMNFLKRHSYAGEGQDGHTPQNIRNRGSNWNIRETDNRPNHCLMDNYSQPQMYRGQNMRQSYNGIDKQVLAKQQNMPTLENTSKSFMRTWRIESYLKNHDMPFGDSCDYLDQFEAMDKTGPFMQGRMRSSLVVRSTIPEQMDPYRYINNPSTGVGSSAALNAPMHYSSMQWNPPASTENRMYNDEFMLQRQGLENNRNNTSFGPGRTSYQSGYASLGRTKGGQIITNPDILADDWQKRHSVADPRSNTDSGPMYGGLGRINTRAGMNVQNGGYAPNVNGDQRSVSHYDVKSITSTNNAHKWQEPPSRAVSAAVLDVKANGMSPQHCVKNSSSKIKSLLNIPERKDDSFGNVDTASLTSGCSTDTLTGGDDEKPSGDGRKPHQGKTISEDEGDQVQVGLKSSKPRLRTEDAQGPHPKATTQKKSSIFDKSTRTSLDRGSWRKDRSADSRLYSRFEPFCSFEKKLSNRPAQSSGNTHSLEKSKSLSKGDSAAENSLSRSARGHHENKLEKFFHRVGNLIHKNK